MEINFKHLAANHPLKVELRKHAKRVIVHTAFLMLGVDFLALIFHAEIGGLVEPLHEALYRTGGVLAVAVYYFEGV